jgi:hypothetical protein
MVYVQMMKIQIIFILVFTIVVSEVSAQSPCEKFLSTTINFQPLLNAQTEAEREALKLSLQNEFMHFSDCGLDSLDIAFFGRPDLFPVVFGSLILHDTITYGDVFIQIQEFMQTADYTKAKMLLQEIAKRKNLIVTELNWTEFYTQILTLFENNLAVVPLDDFAHEHMNGNITYGELFDAYQKAFDAGEIKMNDESSPLKHIQNRNVLENYTTYCDTTFIKEFCCSIYSFTDYTAGISCAVSLNKPVLIYFNAWADVNSRKMEEHILNDDAINSYIADHFVVINLHVDDRSMLPTSLQYISKLSGEKIRTVGGYNSELQITKFQSESQPFFYILDKQENIIAAKAYTNQPADFYTWMVDGFAVWSTK